MRFRLIAPREELADPKATPEEEQQPKLGQARTVAVDWIDRPKVMTAGKDRHQI